MPTLFRCSFEEAFRPQRLLHQQEFTDFKTWADYPRESSVQESNDSGEETNPIKASTAYAVQFVRRVNYGALKSKRYLIPTENFPINFMGITKKDLIKANYKLNL